MSKDATVTLQAFGRRFRLSFADSDDHIARTIRDTGTFYEFEMLTDIRSRLFFAECVVDVGAHVGNHAIFFAAALGIRTVAFEPTAQSFSLLEYNVVANGVSELCTLQHSAVGAATGTARVIDGDDHNSGTARLELDPQGAVDVVTLDDALASELRVDIIKIDVEGWELDVLRGAEATISRCRPLIYIETGPECFADIQRHLTRSAYVCWLRFNATPTFLFLPRERFGFELVSKVGVSLH